MRIAASMRESGADFVAALDVPPGSRVLDLGCGDGTTALPLAELGADVLGIDIARNLVEERVIERFGEAGVPPENVSFPRDAFVFRSPEEVVETFRRFYGPTMNAYATAESAGWAEDLHRRLLGLVSSQNATPDSKVELPATFLRITVRVP